MGGKRHPGAFGGMCSGLVLYARDLFVAWLPSKLSCNSKQVNMLPCWLVLKSGTCMASTRECTCALVDMLTRTHMRIHTYQHVCTPVTWTPRTVQQRCCTGRTAAAAALKPRHPLRHCHQRSGPQTPPPASKTRAWPCASGCGVSCCWSCLLRQLRRHKAMKTSRHKCASTSNRH